MPLTESKDRPIRLPTAVFLVTLIILGCKSDQVFAPKKEETRLVFVNRSNGEETLATQNPLLQETSEYKEQERQLIEHAETCDSSFDPVQVQALSGAELLGVLIGPAIAFVLDQVDKELAELLKKHSGAYAGSAGIQFYTTAGPSSLQTQWTCVRFVRIVQKNDASNPTKAAAASTSSADNVKFDFVAKIALSQELDSIIITPLRLYVADVQAELGSDYAVSVGIKASSVWREQNKGKKATIFNEIALKEKSIDPRKVGKPFVKYYFWDDSKRGVGDPNDWASVRVPIVNCSVPRVGGGTGNGWSVWTVSVAEVGAPSKLLEAAIRLFRESKDDIADLLTAAAKEKLGLIEEE